MLTENHITELVVTYLESQNLSILQKLTSKQKGIDIIAKTAKGTIQYIEVKGETSADEKSSRFNKPFTGNQIWTHVSVALMKTLMLMNKPENEDKEFAIALPANHEPLLNSIKKSIETLGIIVYIVSDNGVKIL